VSGWWDAIAVLLVVVPVVDWLAVAVMTRALRHAETSFGYRPRYLAERRIVAGIIAFTTTLGAVLGLAHLTGSHVDPEAALVMLVAIMVLPSFANALWLWRVVRGDLGT
jgi:hypothetical protein